MKKPEMPQVWQAISYLLCFLLALQITDGLDGTEFSGGWLTGPLLSMADFGILLFLLALLGTFVYPRVAAVVGLASSLLCLPLYLFFLAPVPFNQVFGFGHQFKVQPSPGFHWGKWTVIGLVTLAVTCFMCARRITARNRPQKLPLRPEA
jgi:MFS-type transporter involved in bile tolerance (Atg22 family)